MTANSEVRSADTRPPRIFVWDLPTRLFHWTIVGLLAFSWYTADHGLMRLHLWSGSILLTVLLFRLAWGVFGSTTARFSNFVTHPGAVLRYLRAMGASEQRHAGHNPAGGWMVMVMMAALLAQATLGLFANDDLRFNGPLSLLISKDNSDRLTELHALLFNGILLLVWFHLVAVFYYLLVKGENLIMPMVSGHKKREHVPAGLDLHFASLYIAAAALLLAGVAVWWIVWK